MRAVRTGALAALLVIFGASPALGSEIQAPSTLSFGSVPLGTSTTLNLTVTNTSAGTAEVQGVSFTGHADFTDTGGTCQPYPQTLDPQEACTIQVQFTPSVRGARSATATLTDSDANGDTVALSGTGVAPVVAFSTSDVAFGDQELGTTSSSQGVTIQNNGDLALTITGIAAVGSAAADFAVVNQTCQPLPATVQVGQSCTIQVSFTPGAVGARTGFVRVTSNAPPGQHDLPLTGTGVTVPAFSFDPAALSFGSQLTGTASAPQTLAIANTGTGNLQLDSIALADNHPGDFSIASNGCLPLPQSLAPGEDCVLSVHFAPTATGARAAAVHVVSSIGEHDAAIDGNGAAPLDPVTPASATGEAPPPTTIAQTPPTTTISDPATTPAARCRVPRLVGRTLPGARRALRRAHCRLGKVSRRASAKRPGRVLRQSRRPGARLRAGTRVAVVVSRRL